MDLYFSGLRVVQWNLGVNGKFPLSYLDQDLCRTVQYWRQIVQTGDPACLMSSLSSTLHEAIV